MDDLGVDQSLTMLEACSKQVFQLWITPEREKRMSLGTWTEDQHLSAAQILFDDKGVAQVRFNSEVRGTMKVDPVQPLIPGRPVFLHDIENFIDFELLSDDRDYGHVTVMNQGKPAIFFDFRRNRLSGVRLANLAKQFLNVSNFAFANKDDGPFIDCLFSAYELIAKAKINSSFMGIGETKQHGRIASGINQLSKFGFCPPDFVRVFNDLAGRRNGARYDPRKFTQYANGEAALLIAERELSEYVNTNRKIFDAEMGQL